MVERDTRRRSRGRGSGSRRRGRRGTSLASGSAAEEEATTWSTALRPPRHRGRGLGLRLLDALTRQLPANADRLYIEHFVANERAGAFYEREGFTVERIESSPTGNPALGVVWRVRPLAASAQTAGQA
ncbi:MAG: GNAT family N-acetyltransferase [Nocardioidaceae bacterium]